MYLNRLNPEQKELFIDLCIHAAMANNVFQDEEKKLVDQYCVEMQMPEPRYTANHDFDTAVSRIKEISTPQEIKMILLEITGIILADDVFDDDEQVFMNDFIQKINVSRECLDDMVNSLEKLKRLYVHIDALIAN